MGLNSQQLAAVRHFETPLLVLAGAGSGKTGVITEKIAWLVSDQAYAPEAVVAVTFTNKAAQEMRQRVGRRLDAKLTRKLSISTFHRLGLEILKRDAGKIGLRAGFSIYDPSDAQGLLRELIGEQHVAVEERAAQRLVSAWKNGAVEPAAALAAASSEFERITALLYADYERLLRACNAVDFDDLISLPLRLLDEHDKVREHWQGRIRHLLIDEYQDTNQAQYALMQRLVDRFGALTAVGDDDQSIYSWRGARPQNLVSLGEDYPNLRVIKLEQNYRSSQRILRVANSLICHNPHVFEKRLWSDLGIGDEVRVSVCRHGMDEAEWIVADMLSRNFQQGVRWRDFAILYRSNFQSRPFEQVLREKQIPYSVSGGSSFFEKREIRDVLAYLRLLINPDDDSALLRCINTPRREIGPDTLGKLANHARTRGVSLFSASHELALDELIGARPLKRLRRFADWLTLSADNATRGDPMTVVRGLLDDIDYDSWLESTTDTPRQAERAQQNVIELLEWLGRLLIDDEQRERPLVEAVNRLCLHDMLSRQEAETDLDQVHLCTLHAAKGLEFPHVYIVGMEEEILPHRNSIDSDDIEEERRLAYVGMTRARHTLTLTRCRSRQYHGESGSCEPSRFLDELPADDVQVLGELGTTEGNSGRETGKRHLEGLMELLGTSGE